MGINDLLAELQACANALPPNSTDRPTQVVVRCFAEEFPIEYVQAESFPGSRYEPARTVIAIRIGEDEAGDSHED